MSNLLSICRGVEKAGGEVTLVSTPEEVKKAEKLILPGVGAFPDGMKNLHNLNLVSAIREYVASNKPFLGICLGMQMMLSKGLEMGETEGLNLIEGEVMELPKYNPEGKNNTIPHVGWEAIKKPNESSWNNTPLNEMNEGEYMYFVHSYYAVLKNADNAWCISDFNGTKFTSAIRKNNCFGTQFHPEKSGEKGLELLRNFVEGNYYIS